MYDLIFLGGGPAGYEGAIAAAKNGLKCAVIEKSRLGGTCLQKGCIPTKVLLNSVKTIKKFKTSPRIGVKVIDYEVNIEAMKKYRDGVVSKLTRGIELLFKNSGVDLIKGTGRIINEGEIEVDGSEILKASNIVISTGSHPAQLPFLHFDNNLIMDSAKALELNDIPEELLVIGAGAIGLEMAVIYNLLGSKVTVVEILDQIVPGSDTELSELLKKELKKDRIDIFTSTSLSAPVIKEEEGKVGFKFKNSEKEWNSEFDKVLLSVGRRPNTENIWDNSIKIEKDNKGFIKTDKNLMTSVKSIFACGDVIGQPLLAHKASHQAVAIVDHIVYGKDIPDFTIPAAIFTFPEFASVGLSEKDADELNIEYKVGKFPYSAGSRSNAINEKTGLVKIISDKKNTLIGAHILGAEAGELLPILTFGVMKKMNASDFKELIFIHPTLSENMWEALGEISGFSIHI